MYIQNKMYTDQELGRSTDVLLTVGYLCLPGQNFGFKTAISNQIQRTSIK